jgi:hypothetical protein
MEIAPNIKIKTFKEGCVTNGIRLCIIARPHAKP